jgi:TnpA family transposase
VPPSGIGVLVAQACNVGYGPLVDESNPALREARLRHVAQRYLRPETIAAANARIVELHSSLKLAERWGGGPATNNPRPPRSRRTGAGRRASATSAATWG